MNILIVAAHPDDEILGCGGTAARLALQGDTVCAVILGEGVTSRDEKRDRRTRKSEINDLKKQTKKACRLAGIKKTFSFDLPDNRFDTVPLLDIIKKIESVKKSFAPEIVFTHYCGDLNVDHRLTAEAVVTAFRPLRGETAREIYAFEVPSSTEWGSTSARAFRPNFFVDITNTLDVKLSALQAYSSEMREFPHPRSLEAVRIYAHRWGAQAGLFAAEAFEAVRIIK